MFSHKPLEKRAKDASSRQQLSGGGKMRGEGMKFNQHKSLVNFNLNQCQTNIM